MALGGYQVQIWSTVMRNCVCVCKQKSFWYDGTDK